MHFLIHFLVMFPFNVPLRLMVQPDQVRADLLEENAVRTKWIRLIQNTDIIMIGVSNYVVRTLAFMPTWEFLKRIRFSPWE